MQMNFVQFQATLQKNTDERAVNDFVDLKQHLDEEDFLTIAVQSFEKFWNGVNRNFNNDVGSKLYARRNARPRQPKYRPSHSHTTRMDHQQQPIPELDRSSIPVLMNNDDSLPLLHCSSITLTYYVDIPARIPSSDESFNVAEELNQAPIQSVDIRFKHPVTLFYGPWEDYQRYLLQMAFIPFDFGHVKPFCPRPGQLSDYLFFTTRILVEQDITCTAYYRSEDGERSNNSPNPAASVEDRPWLQIQTGHGSSAVIRTPWVPIEEPKSVLALDVVLTEPRMISSVTEKELISSPRMHIGIHMDFPNRWNEVLAYDFVLESSLVRFFFLLDHARAVTDLLNH
jgi:hypothetical protein